MNMAEIKWYKSVEPVSDAASRELTNGMMEYYHKETATDQSKLYTALGNYYIKTPNAGVLFRYCTYGQFVECAKPARKHLSPL